jgi:hypothetical protein
MVAACLLRRLSVATANKQQFDASLQHIAKASEIYGKARDVSPPMHQGTRNKILSSTLSSAVKFIFLFFV